MSNYFSYKNSFPIVNGFEMVRKSKIDRKKNDIVLYKKEYKKKNKKKKTNKKE